MGIREYLKKFFMSFEDYESWIGDVEDKQKSKPVDVHKHWKEKFGFLDEEMSMSDDTVNTVEPVVTAGAAGVEAAKPLEQTIPQLDLVPIVLNLDYELSVTSSILNILLHRFILGQEGQKEMMGVVAKIRDEVAKNIKAKYPTLNLVFTPPDQALKTSESTTVQ